jgi:hypothetical protein
MDLVAGAKTAIWNEAIPATPASGSYGEKVKSNLDAAVSSRADGAAYTATRAGYLDNINHGIPDSADWTPTRAGYLDAAISSRAAPGADMGLTAAARAAMWNEAIPATPASGSYGEKINSNLDAAVSSRASGADYTAARAGNLDNLDALISSRATPGAAMDLVVAAKTAIWNEAIPATPSSGSYGERVKSNLDAAITSRADGSAYTNARAANLDNLDAAVSGRATPADVDTQLANRGVTSARMAKMDMVAAQAEASGSVAAVDNTAGLTVTLDTGGGANQARAVVEVRYSCGAAAELYAEGSDDNTNWYEGDHISEGAAATDKLVGYLNAHRYFRFRSPTTGIDLSFDIKALL